MEKKLKILCTICARKGSTEILNKNLKKINGHPLIYYTIDQAKRSNIFDKIVVSTDSKKISDISQKLGVHSWFLRPKKLSNDKSPKVLAIKHAFKEAEKHFNKKFNILVDLDATSPLRKVTDIIRAVNKFKYSSANNLVTVCTSKKNPYFNMYEYKNKRLNRIKTLKKNIIRRQDAPIIYENNASIYIWSRKAILKNNKILNKNTIFYEMPHERSIDIDSKFDFEIVKFLIKKNA